MVVKIYISGISGNKEVKKRQQRVLLILDSKNVKYELLDIAEPNMEEAKEYMQNNSKQMGGTIGDPNPRHPLPPQLFNDDDYCGDYDAFDMANEIDEMEKFLKLAPDEIPPTVTSSTNLTLDNGEVPSEGKSKEASPEKEEVDASEVRENGNEDEAAAEEPSKEKSPTPEKEKSPSPQKEKSPTPEKEKSPSPQKEKSPSPIKEDDAGDGENATDDQKAENAENGSKEDDEYAESEENEKAEEA